VQGLAVILIGASELALPIQVGTLQQVARVREHGFAVRIDRAADVIVVDVTERHGVDVAGLHTLLAEHIDERTG
jgi:hypothetical protein